MPSRDKELGPLIRNVFLPEEGEVWCKPDISQQEFRFVVHHAVLRNLPGAKEAAEHYRSNPNADYHAIVAEMTALDRDLAKAVNFAKIYGAGPKKFAEMIGKPLSEARAIIAQYDSRLPFVARLSRICQDEAVERGYTVLYDGARRHWDRYEAAYVLCQGRRPVLLRRGRAAPARSRASLVLPNATARTAPTPPSTRKFKATAARHTKLWMRACCARRHRAAAADARLPRLLGEDARAGRADRAARLRSGAARSADEGRPEIRKELGRRHPHMGGFEDDVC